MDTTTTTLTTWQTPLKGKEFEELLLEHTRRNKHRVIMGRYGVQVAMIDGLWRPVPSMPDFEGVEMGGRQFIVEAKVCAKTSFEVRPDKIKPKQVKHMLDRADYGVNCWLIIHFNARPAKIKTPAFEAITVAVRVHRDMSIWQAYEAGTLKSLSVADCIAAGAVVPWVIGRGCKKALPAFI